MEKLSLYIATAPHHLKSFPKAKQEMKKVLEKLGRSTRLIHWASFSPKWWETRGKKRRTFKERLKIAEDVDLLVGIYMTSAEDEMRALEINHRLTLEKRILLFAHRNVVLSRSRQSMLEELDAPPIIRFDSYLEIIPIVRAHLKDLKKTSAS